MLEEFHSYLNALRREFADKPFSEKEALESPFSMFEKWFDEAVGAQVADPNAMVVSTVHEGKPSSRVVYLRGISSDGIIFYTNYLSRKGHDLTKNPYVAVNFYWFELDRQIRIEGTVEKVSEAQSDDYFNARPRESKIGAWASEQSAEIPERKTLEERVQFFSEKFPGDDVPRPPHWGGYIVKPTLFEFWQGRPNRLHDRLLYSLQGKEWKINRLAP